MGRTQLTKDDILAALPNLNRSELEAIHAIAASLLNGRVSNISNEGVTVRQTIFDALAVTIARPMPYASMPLALAKQYEAYFPDLVIFFDKHFKGWDSNKITQTGFLRMIFGLIAADLKARKVPLSIGAIISNLPRIYEIVDNAFPDYLEANMGDLILKIFTKRSA